MQIGDAEETRGEEIVLELSDEDAFIVHRLTFEQVSPMERRASTPHPTPPAEEKTPAAG